MWRTRVWLASLSLFIGLTASLLSGAAIAGAGRVPAKGIAPSPCIGPRNSDADLDAIINEVFVSKPRELLTQKIISQEFFDGIRDAQYEICDDRVLDVVTYRRKPPLVVFDSFFMTLLGGESQSLVLGQYLAQDHPKLGTLELHTALMRYVLAQNLNKATPSIQFPQLVQQLVGEPTDVQKYLNVPKANGEIENFVLTSFYFVIFHEFCHVHNGDPDRRLQIAKMSSAAAQEAALVQLEENADACAMDIMNRDEAQYKFSPISFICAFMVTSTQAVLEKVLPPQRGSATHPAPQERLDKAYQTSIAYIQAQPDGARYKASIDGVYQHFADLLPK
jgi:hypothetical protein